MKFKEESKEKIKNLSLPQMVSVNINLNSGFLIWLHGNKNYNKALDLIDKGRGILKQLEKEFKTYLNSK